jgi:hypothetical protein
MKTEREIIAFVRINHHLMTITEMSEELRVDMTWIWRLCEDRGWKPIKEADRPKDKPIWEKERKKAGPVEQWEIPGLWEVALLVYHEMTPEEKKRWAQRIIVEKYR